MLTTQIKHLVGGVASAAVLSLPYAQPLDIPSIKMSNLPACWGRASSGYNPNPYYDMIVGAQTEQRQKEILQKFVSNLLQNAEGPDPVFTKIVNEHFWDLI